MHQFNNDSNFDLVAAFVILLVTQSTFTVWGIVKISMTGIGTIEPSDLCMAYIVVKYYFIQRGFQRIDKIDALSILIGSWISISSIFNFLFDDLLLQQFLTNPLRLSFLWLCLPALRRLGTPCIRKLSWCVLFIAVITMVIHIYVQVWDRRDLMSVMYYAINDSQTYQLLHADYIRATPSGQLLSGAVFASCLLIFCSNVVKVVKSIVLPLSLVILIGLVVNITRSTLISALILSPILVLATIQSPSSKMMIRIFILCLSAISVLASLSLIVPEIKERYIERFQNTNDYYSASTFNPRISDNVMAFEEITENPITGNGFPQLRYYVTDTGGDVHSYVMMCLQGGIPLILFFIFFVYEVWKNRGRNGDLYCSLGKIGFLYILIMWAAVAPGANGPHTLRELAPFLLFTAMFTRRITTPTLQGCEILPQTASDIVSRNL